MNITEEQFLSAEVNTLNLTMRNADFVALAQELTELVKKYNPTSVLDYGCGTGVYSETMRQAGLNVTAQDIFKSHRDYCKSNYPELKVLQKPSKAELMVWIEVAEHMTDDQIKKALKSVDPKIIVFSSTPNKTEFDADWGHINIKSEKEWLTMFKELGYKLIERPKTPTLWALTFQKI